MKTILSIDPGKVNMGYGVIQYNNNKYRIVKRGKIKNTIQDLKDYNLKQTVLKFNQEIEDMIDKYKITEITMERFVSRGIRGSLSEYICIMQGILAINPKITAFNLVTAATWKNAFNKVYVLKDFYNEYYV
jgi:Holliday junction resolvasome RuvABC endonuclease subunit